MSQKVISIQIPCITDRSITYDFYFDKPLLYQDFLKYFRKKVVENFASDASDEKRQTYAKHANINNALKYVKEETWDSFFHDNSQVEIAIPVGDDDLLKKKMNMGYVRIKIVDLESLDE